MASKNKTYELALKIAGKVDSSLGKACKQANDNLASIGNAAKKAGKIAAAAAGTAAAAAATLAVTSTKKAIEFESTMADVAKVVDGLRDENGGLTESYYKMADSLLEMSENIPMTVNELGQIMAAAGQAGIAQEDLSRFTETAAKMGVAFDTTAEQAGEWLATWRTALNLNQSEVEALGDKLNLLGNTTSENALKLAEVVTRVGSLAQVSGLAAEDVAALAASMPGVSAEISATGIKNMMLALTAGSSATDKQVAVLQKLGFSAKGMAKRMQTDAKGAIMDFLGAVQKLPEAERAATLSKFFGKESVSSIAPLLQNLGYLKEQFDKVGDASAYSGSMEQEYAVRADTTANTIQLIQNKIAAIQTRIGQKILPYINKGLDILSESVLPAVSAKVDEIMPKIQMAAETLWANRDVILKVAAGIAAAAGAFSAMKAAKTAVDAISGFDTVLSAGVKHSGVLGTVVKLLGGKFTIIAAAVALAAGAFVYLWNKSEKFRAAAMGLWEKVKPLLQALQSMAELIGRSLAPQIEFLASLVVNGLEQAFLTLAPIIENIMGVFTGLINFITGVFSGNWEQAWQGICDIVGNLFKGLVNITLLPINAIIGGVNAVIGAINKCGFTIPEWVPVIGGKNFSINIPTIPPLPALAAGGIATAPTLAQIGEGGEPEAVLPLSKLADLLGGKGKPKPQTGGGGTGGEPITFAPVFNFYGSVTRKDAEEAGRISFAEFKRLYDRMRAEERRKSFSPT